MDRIDGSLGLVLKKKPDLELEAGARAHFEDAHYYAKTYNARIEDARYYSSYVEQKGVDAVLEQGIGNGRIALPIARAGVSVTGIDHSAPMLDHLRDRLKTEPRSVQKRIALHLGDIRSTKIARRRFPLIICPFNAALHLYEREDVEQWLARTHEHLAPDGELVFDISMPILEDLCRDPNVAYRIPSFEHPSAGRVNYREHFDYDRVRQILFVSMFFSPMSRGTATQKKSAKGGRSKVVKDHNDDADDDGTFMTPLAHRQFYPREMEALLHYNGFDVTNLYGDFKGGPLGQRSDVMVFHARPRSSTTRLPTKRKSTQR